MLKLPLALLALLLSVSSLFASDFSSIKKGQWGKFEKQDEPFHFYYGEKGAMFVDGFVAWEGRKEFLKYVQREFGWQMERLPVVLPDTEDGFRKLLKAVKIQDDPTEACRSRGGHRGIALCITNMPMETHLRAASMSQSLLARGIFEVIIHEATHAFEMNRCLEANRYSGNGQQPPRWLREGYAEWMAMKFNPKYRQFTFEKFQNDYLKLDKRPTLAEINAVKDERAMYSVSAIFTEHLASQFGNSKVNRFHVEICTGTPIEDAAKKAFEAPMDQLFATFWDVQTGAKADASVAQFQGENGAPQLKYAPDAKKEQRLKIPITESPDIDHMYMVEDAVSILDGYWLDFTPYPNRLEGEFRGPDGEKVTRLSADLYVIEMQGARIQVKMLAERPVDVRLVSNGHTVVSTYEGYRAWHRPDGKSVACRRGGPCRHDTK